MNTNLLVICLFVFGLSNAQPYFPMLEEDHTWSVDVYFNPLDDPPPFTQTFQVTVSGSVVVDGKTYKKVFSGDIETDCLIREEDGLVYQLDLINATEVIKYDFTLEVGDFFIFENGLMYCSYNWFNNTDVPPLEVVAVDTQFIAGQDRKVIIFEFISTNNPTYFPEIWVEGIGSLRGFDPLGETVDVADGTSLVCFDIAGTNYFFNNATSCDNTTLGIDDLSQDQIVLYPNPVTSTSILQFSSDGIVDMLKIYDVSGKLVKEEKVNKDYVLIDAMQYPSGLYFYQVYSENKLLKTEKFIIK
ncbi:MAG: T9SS type A sorting domain-containing protein [Bacteroidetes bacterium]|nr:T9SS type A sorting domain-containing protein [Bacteroidota bacterium]